MTSIEELLLQDHSKKKQDKIVVCVRLRPLNAKEKARKDMVYWNCINDETIIYKNHLIVSDRSMNPTSYTFDRVFGPECSTRQVYDQGVKEVSLSVLDGVHACVFAYGQTNSGKTYTMSGITDYALADIYSYIYKHKERKFILKFSAMEIYNESVRDLLSANISPLKLLDDPKTVESAAASEYLANDKFSTLAATVSFIDLAGSERASQPLSASTRLKEGCHINRSLLTLGTVVRKLSEGKTGHIPFRDSKLTRILQSSLRGNARTAIVCTISPAKTHVEQSRKTLLFAKCAKQVTTNAQVNVAVSDKALIKRLQSELSSLRSQALVVFDTTSLLKEKDLQIEKLNKEVLQLTQQLDQAHSRIEELQQNIEQIQQYPKQRVCGSHDSLCHVSSLPSSNISPQLTVHDSDENVLKLSNFTINYGVMNLRPIFSSGAWNQPLVTQVKIHGVESKHGPKIHMEEEKSDDTYKDLHCIEGKKHSFMLGRGLDRRVDLSVLQVTTQESKKSFVSKSSLSFFERDYNTQPKWYRKERDENKLKPYNIDRPRPKRTLPKHFSHTQRRTYAFLDGVFMRKTSPKNESRVYECHEGEETCSDRDKRIIHLSVGFTNLFKRSLLFAYLHLIRL
ncbi:unnamed protein product [Cochlearia groenlandica]